MTRPPADLEARIRAHRDAAQARFDSHGLPRLGTTNRALSEWIADNEFLIVPRESGRSGSSHRGARTVRQHDASPGLAGDPNVDRQRAGEAASD